ncbi:MAG: hypothetical protein J6K47_00825 [Clostridia bacterium]|nr:hypothetical protein [Clostridia bacterium]
MTYARRDEIFCKDFLDIKDIEDLLGLSYGDAAEVIREIKRWGELSGRPVRLNVKGKIHVQDYFDYFRIENVGRYVKRDVGVTA